MGKGARLRAERRSGGVMQGPGSDADGSTVRIGRGRPRGAVRRRLRASQTGSGEVVVQPWQGYGNAIAVGFYRVKRWKSGQARSKIRQMDAYLEEIKGSGQLKTIEDVAQVRERDDRDRLLKR